MSALDCRAVEDRLLDYLYDDLSPEERQQVEAHLAECPACTAKVAGYRRVRQAARGLPLEEPPPQVAVRLLQAAAGRNVLPLPLAPSAPGRGAEAPLARPGSPGPGSLSLVEGPAPTGGPKPARTEGVAPGARARTSGRRWLAHPAWAAAAVFVAVGFTASWFLATNRSVVTAPASERSSAPSPERSPAAAPAPSPEPSTPPPPAPVERSLAGGRAAEPAARDPLAGEARGTVALSRDTPRMAEGGARANRPQAAPEEALDEAPATAKPGAAGGPLADGAATPRRAHAQAHTAAPAKAAPASPGREDGLAGGAGGSEATGWAVEDPARKGGGARSETDLDRPESEFAAAPPSARSVARGRIAAEQAPAAPQAAREPVAREAEQVAPGAVALREKNEWVQPPPEAKSRPMAAAPAPAPPAGAGAGAGAAAGAGPAGRLEAREAGASTPVSSFAQAYRRRDCAAAASYRLVRARDPRHRFAPDERLFVALCLEKSGDVEQARREYASLGQDEPRLAATIDSSLRRLASQQARPASGAKAKAKRSADDAAGAGTPR